MQNYLIFNLFRLEAHLFHLCPEIWSIFKQICYKPLCVTLSPKNSYGSWRVSLKPIAETFRIRMKKKARYKWNPRCIIVLKSFQRSRNIAETIPQSHLRSYISNFVALFCSFMKSICEPIALPLAEIYSIRPNCTLSIQVSRIEQRSNWFRSYFFFISVPPGTL